MSKAWERDLDDSKNHFCDIVWPQIKQWFGADAKLLKTEGRETALAKAFDAVMGVDYWTVDDGRGMAGIASRVQTYDKTTFTIRYERGSGVDTEHQKRLQQLNDDGLELPTYTLQAYVDPVLELLRNVAVCKTAELYAYIDETVCPGSERHPLIGSDESERFYPIAWTELDEHIDLKIYNRERANIPHSSSQQTTFGRF